MISIREAVESLVSNDYGAQEGLTKGWLNLSQYARSIQGSVSEFTKKEVGTQSIVVTLARLEKKFREKKRRDNIEVRQLAVQSPIVQLVYPKTRENLRSLITAIQSANDHEDVFFSFSTSTKDIALVVSEKFDQEIRSGFEAPPFVEKRGLSAVSVRFDEELVSESNVGLILLQKLASHNIVLDAAMTTYNEFTLVFESRFLHDAIEALSGRSSSRQK